MSTVTERLQLLITASAKGVASEIKGVEAASGSAAGKTGLLQQALSKVGLEGASTGTILKTGVATATAVAGAAFAKFAADGIEQFASLTGEVRGFQRVSGATAEDSSKLVFAVKELGIAPDAAASAFGRLATRIGTGKVDLSEYGVEIAKNKDGTVDLAGTVANLSDAYQKTEDPTKRAALANDAFGKSWQTLAPLLGKGADDLQKIYAQAGKDHQIFSQADLEAGRQFTVATSELKSALQGLEVETGRALVPIVTTATQGFTQGVQASDQLANSVGFDGLAGAFKTAYEQTPGLNNAMHLMTASSDLLKGHFSDAAGEFARSVPVVGNVISLFDDGSDSSNKFTDAQQRQKDATTNLANAVAEHGKHSQEAKDAEKELASASSDLEGVQRKVSGALQDVNDKLLTNADRLYAAATASQTASADHLNLDNALANVTRGMLDLAAAQADGSTSSFELEQKQRDLAAQVLAVEAAAQKQAVDALPAAANAQDRQTASSQAGAKALQDLYDKYPGLREQVHGYVGDVYTVPTIWGTQTYFDATQAYKDLADWQAALNAVNRVVDVTVRITGEVDDAVKKWMDQG